MRRNQRSSNRKQFQDKRKKGIKASGNKKAKTTVTEKGKEFQKTLKTLSYQKTIMKICQMKKILSQVR